MKFKHYHIQHIQPDKIWEEAGCGIIEDVMNHFQKDLQENKGTRSARGGNYSFTYIPFTRDFPRLKYCEKVISCSNPECEKHPEFYTSLFR